MTPVFYSYDNLGRRSLTTFGDFYSTGVVGAQSFQYDIRGWLLGSNAQLDNNIVFGEMLRYENPSNPNSIARWDGNISESSISRFDGSYTPAAYSHNYSYDGFKRLSNALYRNGSGTPLSLMTEKDITYDRNGNVTGLKRYDADGILNKLLFVHSGNRIAQNANDTWSYDNNGNMTHNAIQGLDLEYNLLNLPREARHMNDTVSYRYLADGTKLSALTNVGDGLKYRGNFVYETIAEPVDWYDDMGNHITDPILWECLSSIAWDEGRIIFDNPFAVAVDSIVVDELILEEGLQAGLLAHGFEFGEQIDTTEAVVGLIGAMHDEWFVKDHLGSVRAIVRIDGDAVSATDRITEVNDYLPFGTRIPTDFQASTNRHRFSGKEEQRFGSLDMGAGGDRVSLNHLDFGARFYDPGICRWTTIDPMAESTVNYTPYSYCLNNPVLYFDPFGLSHYKVGEQTYTIDDGDPNFRMDVFQKEYDELKHKFERNELSYARYRNRLSKKNGFTNTETVNSGHGAFTLNASVITYHKPGNESYMESQETSIMTSSLNALLSAATSKNVLNRINIGSNQSLYLMHNNGRIFNGNQYVSVINLWKKYGKSINVTKTAIAGLSTLYLSQRMDPVSRKLFLASAATGEVVTKTASLLLTPLGISTGAILGPGGAVTGGFIGNIVGSALGGLTKTIISGCY